MNASVERKLSDIRSKIKNFAQFKPIDGHTYRIILLDEADALKRDAQSALRRIMEQHSRNLRFILIVNYANGIISTILSRCAVFRYLSLPDFAIMQQINALKKLTGINIEDEAVQALVHLSRGDMRKILNLMQSLTILKSDISLADVYEIAGFVHPQKIDQLINMLLNDKQRALEKVIKKLDFLIYESGYQGKDLVYQFNSEIQKNEAIPVEHKLQFNLQVGEADFRITQGSNELIQLSSLMAVISTMA